MKILAIETSCDETAAAIVENGTTLLSHALASSAQQHEKTGGIVPEVGARQQMVDILPIIDQVVKQNPQGIDAIAVTVGPGLMGSLMIGVETAKALAWVWDKPLIPVDHVVAHAYAPWVYGDSPRFPALCLIVSGGHTEFILMKDHGNVEFLGGTRDDAVGEAFDKVARLIGLPYPGGPEIEKLSHGGNPSGIPFPRPMINDTTLEMSFSGIKTAVKEVVSTGNQSNADIAASFQQAIIDVLIVKTQTAIDAFNPSSLIVAGGVAANRVLAEQLHSTFDHQCEVYVSPIKYSVDNAAVIGSYAYFVNKPTENIFSVTADPNYHAKKIGTSRNLKP